MSTDTNAEGIGDMAAPTHEYILQTLRQDRANIVSGIDRRESRKTEALNELIGINAALREDRNAIALIDDAIDALVRAALQDTEIQSHGDGR